MTCSTCERIRRFFRDGAAKVAPFTEYTIPGARILVSNYTGEVVDGHPTYIGAVVTVTKGVTGELISFQWSNGLAAGTSVTKSRKLFRNPFRE